jgi:hypothetical protein
MLKLTKLIKVYQLSGFNIVLVGTIYSPKFTNHNPIVIDFTNLIMMPEVVITDFVIIRQEVVCHLASDPNVNI